MVTTYFEKTHKEPFPHFSTKRSAWRNLLRTIKASSGYTFGITFVKIFLIQSLRGLLYHNSYINTARDFSIVYLERKVYLEQGREERKRGERGDFSIVYLERKVYLERCSLPQARSRGEEEGC